VRIYDPKEWFSILFQFHKFDTARKLSPLIGCISVYSFGVVLLELHVLHISKGSFFSNFYTLHNLLGFALSLLLVFRTNTAYDRWWEGRKQWGALVNNSRNLALKIHALLPANETAHRVFFRRTIALYARVLTTHLQSETTRYALDETEHPEAKDFDTSKHMPNQVASLMTDRVIQMQREGLITGEQLLFINNELMSFTDICGACERIKNTPIPYSYSAFIKKFIFIYIMTLPFGYVLTLGYWVIPVVALVFYVLGSLEVIAEEIEEPFGTDSNDLPLEKIADNIRKHVAEIL
jgi:putative membrane protein